MPITRPPRRACDEMASAHPLLRSHARSLSVLFVPGKITTSAPERSCFFALALQRHRVLFGNRHCFIVRNHSQHRNPRPALQKIDAAVEDLLIAAELVDDQAFHAFSLAWSYE